MQSVYEKCPKHPNNDIILFCLGGSCLEPLCKECCKLHVHWHNSQGSRAEIDTVDNVRTNCVNDIHSLKVKFEEERAMLHHFSDEGDDFVQKIHRKLERVRQTLNKVIEDYCKSLEVMIAEKVKKHKSAHPGQQSALQTRLERVIAELDSQEKSLLSTKYMRPLLTVLMEEKNHDLDGVSREIDTQLKSYLENMFDVFVHEDHVNEIKQSLHHYVAVEPAYLEEELRHYTQKIREGKKVFGMDSQGNPKQSGQQQNSQQQFKSQSPQGDSNNRNNYGSSGNNSRAQKY